MLALALMGEPTLKRCMVWPVAGAGVAIWRTTRDIIGVAPSRLVHARHAAGATRCA